MANWYCFSTVKKFGHLNQTKCESVIPIQYSFLQCCGFKMIFFGPGSYISISPDLDPVYDPTWFFCNNLNINFAFEFPSCKCVMTRCNLFRRRFRMKMNLHFKLSIFLVNCKILSDFQRSFTSNSFRIRSYLDPELFLRIRILLKGFGYGSC